MSVDGMSCRLKIDEIIFECQQSTSNNANSVDMQLSGELRTYYNLDLNRTNSTASAYIRFYKNTEVATQETDWPDTCVGNIYLRKQKNTEAHATINLILDWCMLDKLLILKNDIIFIEPLFYREDSSKERYTETVDDNETISYIKTQVSGFKSGSKIIIT